MRCVRWLLVFLVVTFCVACGKEDNTQKKYDFYNDFENLSAAPIKKDASNSEKITDTSMTAYFQSSYGFQNLLTHNVLWDETRLQVIMQFVFDSSTSLWQMDSAREYGLNTFVFKQMLYQVLQKYQMWAREQEIQHVFVEIFVEASIVAQDYYHMVGSIVKDEFHYETSEIICKNQCYQLKNKATHERKLKKYLPQESEIQVRSNLKEDKIIFTIISKTQVNPDNLDNIEKEISLWIDEPREIFVEFQDFSKNVYYQKEIYK